MEASTAPRDAFEFSGKGADYFRIWIVNLVLTILTLGIYSAWAKVRRMQYFYRNTSLRGNSFEFHGNPIAILKGRLIAVGLLVLYNVTAAFSPLLGILVFIGLIVAMPWLLQRSIAFRLFNSSYRGLRFRFNGSVQDAYKAFLGWGILGYITLGLLFPMAHQRIKAYQHNNSAFGTAPFSFGATVRAFYLVYLKLFGLVLIPLILLGIVMGSANLFAGLGDVEQDPMKKMQTVTLIMFAVTGFYLAVFLVIWPWFSARMQNLVWNHTALGPHAFTSGVRARDLLVIMVTNFVGIVLTLGLFKPFADIRMARYRLTHMGVQAQGSLDEFLAQEQSSVNAMGEETADVFDVDISF